MVVNAFLLSAQLPTVLRSFVTCQEAVCAAHKHKVVRQEAACAAQCLIDKQAALKCQAAVHCQPLHVEAEVTCLQCFCDKVAHQEAVCAAHEQEVTRQEAVRAAHKHKVTRQEAARAAQHLIDKQAALKRKAAEHRQRIQDEMAAE